MASQKALKGVAYDIAHHAQSGLSCLHPHMGELCRELNLNETTIDLVSENRYPDNLREHRSLYLAIDALYAKLLSILAKREMELSFIKELKLKFIFFANDNYQCSVESTLLKLSGVKYVQLVK